MHILLVTIGSAGDVYPMIALGAGLARRGFRVTLATNPHFEGGARSAGLDFAPLGSVADYVATVRDPDLWSPSKGFGVVTRRGLLPSVRPVYDWIAAYDPKRTLVAASGLCFGARIAQEKLAFRLASVHLQPAMLRSVYDPPTVPGLPLRLLPRALRRLLFRAIDALLIDRLLAPGVNAFRRELGLPPVRRFFASWVHSPTLVLGLFPPWFASAQPDWPPHTRLTGFLGHDAATSSETALAPELVSFLDAGDPPVVFTQGTAMAHAASFFSATIDFAQRTGRRAILLARERSQLPAGLPPSMLALDYVPFRALLPRARALVHHGGIGTVAQALGAGIPQLITPLAHDQHDNAARVVRLGVGAMLAPKQADGAGLAATLERLLRSGDVKARCVETAQQVHFERWIEESCDAVLGLQNSEGS